MTDYIRRILGTLTIISVTICLGTQANGQSTADLEKLNKMAGNKPPAKKNRRPAKAAPAATNSGNLKVPKFGVETIEKTTVQTFAAPTETIEYSEKVKAKAQSTLSRYDRDKNGLLDEVELASGNWRPSPLTTDKNGDGRLSLAELQDRYHQQSIEKQKYREAMNQRRESRNGMPGGRGRQAYSPSWRGTSNDGTNGTQEISSADSDRARKSSGRRSKDSTSRDSSRDSSESTRSRRSRSSRSNSSRITSSGSRISDEASSAFKKLDINKDRLVEMHEFSDTWPKDKLEEFRVMDSNGDGVLSPEEW